MILLLMNLGFAGGGDAATPTAKTELRREEPREARWRFRSWSLWR
mgnify:CR=1 FL=1